jgi:hypothetical protein
MNPGSTDTGAPLAQALRRPCPSCRQGMQGLRLAGHYEVPIDIDLCLPCHLVWFDHDESQRLSASGMLRLLERIAASHAVAAQGLRPQLDCPHCARSMKLVHNLTLNGRSLQYNCPAAHGKAQTFVLYLAEKGVLRPVLVRDVSRLGQADDGGLECINCGAAVPAGVSGQASDHAQCAYCSTPLYVLDVDALADLLLRMTPGPDRELVQRQAGKRVAGNCGQCGAALAPGLHMRCAHCTGTLATSHLTGALAALPERMQATRERRRGSEFAQMPSLDSRWRDLKEVGQRWQQGARPWRPVSERSDRSRELDGLGDFVEALIKLIDFSI